jgi:hypothetical protein
MAVEKLVFVGWMHRDGAAAVAHMGADTAPLKRLDRLLKVIGKGMAFKATDEHNNCNEGSGGSAT